MMKNTTQKIHESIETDNFCLQVIAGWDAGLEGMCVGETRTLVIPPDQAYGADGVGSVIPACSTLVFDVELLDIQ